MNDYHDKPLRIGDYIQNIESGWHGRIQTTESRGARLMLVCLGVNWWTGKLDHDDKQWHAPRDVIRVSHAPDHSLAPNPFNFL